MENLIREVIELDKSARARVQELEAEKAKIGDFVREQKKLRENAFHEEITKRIDEVRAGLEKELAIRNKEIQAEYDQTLAELEKAFLEKKQAWVDEIYSYCVEQTEE
ncbi:MAG: hypothetical protein PHP32_05035 [Candidatus Izemoplasmatales bacterium]|nr:hypothetical protein [Candidatus Izemoplasmatales bacterium]